jgi:hypothetical protein
MMATLAEATEVAIKFFAVVLPVILALRISTEYLNLWRESRKRREWFKAALVIADMLKLAVQRGEITARQALCLLQMVNLSRTMGATQLYTLVIQTLPRARELEAELDKSATALLEKLEDNVRAAAGKPPVKAN